MCHFQKRKCIYIDEIDFFQLIINNEYTLRLHRQQPSTFALFCCHIRCHCKWFPLMPLSVTCSYVSYRFVIYDLLSFLTFAPFKSIRISSLLIFLFNLSLNYLSLFLCINVHILHFSCLWHCFLLNYIFKCNFSINYLNYCQNNFSNRTLYIFPY